jgi:DNA-directed RNA polymerase subunit RPC12/RpoP
MQCPNCGSWRVERSRRRGTRERWFLPLRATYPFRCRECDTRFLVKLWSLRDRLRRLKRRPPSWLRALAWVVGIGGLGLVLAFAMVTLNSTSVPKPKAPPVKKK